MKSSKINEEMVMNQTFIIDRPLIILVDDNELMSFYVEDNDDDIRK